MRHLLVLAHPDDETLFFGGLILSRPTESWDLICVTDGNGEGRKLQRSQELQAASKALGIHKIHQWDFLDDPHQRLQIDEIVKRMKNFGDYDEYWTHGPIGEYGHHHHQDISYAVHRYANQEKRIVNSLAYNASSQFQVQLNQQQFEKKFSILSTIYKGETKRFFNFLPCTQTESFNRLEFGESAEIYQLLSTGKKPDLKHIQAHKNILPFIESGDYQKNRENFLKHYFSSK